MATTPNLGIISPTSLSFEQILEDLLVHAKNKPDGMAWQDWLKSSDGTIVAEWIAGLGTFRAYHEMMRIRESQLDHAQLPSSVFNLAFNKGLLVPPARAPELEIEVSVPAQKSIDYGDLIGMVGDYEMYSLDAKTIEGQNQPLRVVIGRQQEWSQNVPGLKKFQTFKYTANEPFFAQQLEQFLVDGAPIQLLSDPDYLNERSNDFLLRRVMPNQSRVYIGNNVIGWYQQNVTNVTYRVLTYDRDILTSLMQTPRLSIDGILNAYNVVLQPSFDPDKEEVREIARYYPIDGRIVADPDYGVVIRKNFGGIVEDVYAFNTDPDQQVHLLKSDNFGTGTQEAEYLRLITQLVNSKRALGMHVVYHLHPKSDGKAYTTHLMIAKDDYTNELVESVNSYLRERLYTFMRSEQTFTTVKVAVDLSAKFNVRFYPNANDTLTMAETDFFQSFYVNVSSF